MIENVRNEVHVAALDNQKLAMFHFQVLSNVDELKDIDPEYFCRGINVPKGYVIEFQQMINLTRIMDQRGFRFIEKSSLTYRISSIFAKWYVRFNNISHSTPSFLI